MSAAGRLTLRIPRDLLTSKRNDLVVLLRIGAGVNALEATARLLRDAGHDQSSATQLNRLHLFLSALAYLREIVNTISKTGYEDRLFELVEKGTPFAPVKVATSDVRPLLSTSHPEIGGNVLLKIRDKVAFHWDAEPFKAFLDSPDRLSFDIFTVDGEPLDRVFTSSAHAHAQFAFEVPFSGTTPEDWMERLIEAVALVGHALESAFLGLIAEVDSPPTK